MPRFKPSYVMIHHSATEDGPTLNTRGVFRWHIVRKRWNDVAYNAIAERIGDQYQILFGRPPGIPGAHCREGGMNRKAYSICVIGNHDVVQPDPVLLRLLGYRVILPVMETYGIYEENIVFHREYATYKSCPGKLFTKAMVLNALHRGISTKEIRRLVVQGVEGVLA